MSVQELVDAAQARTEDAIYQANYFVDILDSLAGSWIDWTYNEADYKPISAPATIAVGAATNNDKTIDQSSVSGARVTAENNIPGSIEEGGIEEHFISDFTLTPITPEIPEKPEFVNYGAPNGQVDLETVTVVLDEKPSPVVSVTHDEPALSDPNAINVQDYTIDNDAPEMDYLVPTNQFAFVETAYSSSFRDAILAVLLDDIQNGGTGINPDDEQALFDRAKDREASVYAVSLREIDRVLAAKGGKIRSIARESLTLEARHSYEKAQSGINREILLRRSELYVQARQFAIQNGTTLDNAKLSFHGSVMERSLNAARLVAEFGINYHNLHAAYFHEQLIRWQTISDVKTQWVDNIIKATKEYELKLAKMDLIDKRNARRTELMNAMNRAVEIAENIRKTELEIAGIKIENNKQKIEQSKLLTQNYAELMRSNEIAFRAYAEAIRAENLRNEPYRLSLDGHREERETALAKLQMQVGKKEGDIKVMAANLQRAEQYLEKYYRELENTIRIADEKAKLIGLDLEGWRSHLHAGEVNARLKLEARQADVRSYLDTIRTNLDGVTSEINAWIGVQDVKSKAALGGISLYENLVMGAQSALGTIATLSE